MYLPIIHLDGEQHSASTVLCKSNASKIRRNSSFVLATFLRKVIKFSKDVSKGSKR